MITMVLVSNRFIRDLNVDNVEHNPWLIAVVFAVAFILPYVFDSVFFEEDLNLKTDQVVGYLEYIDSQMKSSELLKQSKQFELIDYLINKSRDYKEVLSR